MARTSLIFGILLGWAAGVASAQAPADVPPEDFAGRQFVDSRGCVFIRAEVNGTVTWVPRLNREREVLCGFQPTFAGAAGEVAGGSLPTVAPDVPPSAAPPAPAAIAVAAPEPAPAPVAVKPAPRKVASAAPVRTKRQSGSAAPKGFAFVWDDGRLNPHRGPRTVAGDQAMAKIWTNDVPMRLVTE